MVTSALAILLLLLAAAGASVLTNRKPEECLPVCFCAAVLWLYGFYCLGLIRLALVLLCAGILCLFLFGWRKSGSLKQYLAAVFTPGTAVYLCFCLFFLIFFSRNPVSRHDELRLWGAVPKAIHETGALQLGHQSPIFATMQSYPPGLPLMSFFFTAFSREFSEGALFVGYACMALSFLLPSFSKWEWKHWRLLSPAALLVLLTPFVFTSHNEDAGLFGMTLYVDPLLGMAAGYAYYLAGHRPFKDRFRLISFSLTLAVLCLLKDTGLVFAVTALVLALILGRKELRLSALVPVLAVAVSIGSWKLLLKLYDVHALVPLKLHLLSKEALGNILKALVSVNVVARNIPLGFFASFLFVFLALWVLYILAFRVQKEQGRKEAWIVALGILLSTAAFVYGYALIYGETLESFARYMATPLLGLATYILLTAIPCLPGQKLLSRAARWSRGLSLGILSGCVVVSLCAGAVWQLLFTYYPELPAADETAAKIRAVTEPEVGEGETGWVYLVMAGDGWENSFYHHRVFFDLISPNINLRNGLAKTQVVIPGVADPAKVWAEELKDGCDFVYLLSVEDALLPVFAQLSDDPAKENSLYRVCPGEGPYGVSLQLVE